MQNAVIASDGRGSLIKTFPIKNEKALSKHSKAYLSIQLKDGLVMLPNASVIMQRCNSILNCDRRAWRERDMHEIVGECAILSLLNNAS